MKRSSFLKSIPVLFLAPVAVAKGMASKAFIPKLLPGVDPSVAPIVTMLSEVDMNFLNVITREKFLPVIKKHTYESSPVLDILMNKKRR